MSISKKGGKNEDGDGPLAKQQSTHQQMIWCLCLYSLLHLHISDPCSFFHLSFYPLILHPPFSLPQSISVIFHPVIVARFISCLLSSPNLSKQLFPIVHHFLLISSPFPPLVFSPFLATICFNSLFFSFEDSSSFLSAIAVFLLLPSFRPLLFSNSLPSSLSFHSLPFPVSSPFIFMPHSFSSPLPRPSSCTPLCRRTMISFTPTLGKCLTLPSADRYSCNATGWLGDPHWWGKIEMGGSQCVEMDDVWEVKSAQRVNHGIERWSEKGQRGFFQCHPVIPHTSSSPLHPHFISFPLSLSLTYPLFIFPLTDRYMHFSHSNSVTFMNVQRLQSEVRERERGRLSEGAAASDDSATAQRPGTAWFYQF